MHAVVYDGPRRVRVTSVAEPRLEGPDDAVVAVRRSAICGTDLHLVAHGDGLAPGTVLGHEFVGSVHAVGDAVRGVRVGDSVVGADFTACGRCWWCRRGDHWECAQRQFFGTGSAFGPPLAGSQAEFVRVPHADVVLRLVPEGVTDDVAVFVGDALATAYAAVRRSCVEPGDLVAVMGGGPVGQLCAQVAQACGAGVVVLTEPLARRRDLATACGVLAAEPAATAGTLRGLSDGRGADVVIDAVGGAAMLDTALGLVRRRGRVVSVGVPRETGWNLPLARAFADELTVGFAVGDAMRDADALFGLLAGGAVDPLPLVTDRVSLRAVGEAFPRAFDRAFDRAGLKTLVDV